MKIKYGISFLLLVMFITVISTSFAQESEYETDAELSFFGKYEFDSPTKPDGHNPQIIDAQLKENNHFLLPQTGQIQHPFLIYSGLFLVFLTILFKNKYRK